MIVAESPPRPRTPSPQCSPDKLTPVLLRLRRGRLRHAAGHRGMCAAIRPAIDRRGAAVLLLTDWRSHAPPARPFAGSLRKVAEADPGFRRSKIRIDRRLEIGGFGARRGRGLHIPVRRRAPIDPGGAGDRRCGCGPRSRLSRGRLLRNADRFLKPRLRHPRRRIERGRGRGDGFGDIGECELPNSQQAQQDDDRVRAAVAADPVPHGPRGYIERPGELELRDAERTDDRAGLGRGRRGAEPGRGRRPPRSRMSWCGRPL
jgi:hypothetical protein